MACKSPILSLCACVYMCVRVCAIVCACMQELNIGIHAMFLHCSVGAELIASLYFPFLYDCPHPSGFCSMLLDCNCVEFFMNSIVELFPATFCQTVLYRGHDLYQHRLMTTLSSLVEKTRYRCICVYVCFFVVFVVVCCCLWLSLIDLESVSKR